MSEPQERRSAAAGAETRMDQNSLARGPRRRVGRRRLITAAVGTGAAVVGASGVYVRPSVRPLQVPTVHAFSF